jgi:hypothetical protein
MIRSQHSILVTGIMAMLLVSIPGCFKDKVYPAAFPGMTELAIVPVKGTGATLEIWHDGALKEGYSKLHMVLRDSANPATLIPDAHIMMMPMAAVGGSGGADAPYEEPEGSDAERKFLGGILFPTAGNWTLHTTVHNHLNDEEAEVFIPVTVSLDTPSTHYSFADTDTTGMYIAWAPPAKPDYIGMNDLELVVFRRQADHSWAPDSSYSLTINPVMPSMGHGSDGNVNPVHEALGHYLGKVNYSMAGDWKVTVTPVKNGVPATSFDFYRTVK